MNWYNYLLIFPTFLITVFVELLSYNKLRNSKFSINKKIIMMILIAGILLMINTYTNDSLSRTIISFIILFFTSMTIYSDSYIDTFARTLICYIFIMLVEIILSVILLNINIINLNQIDTNVLFKTIFSFINIGLVYYFTSLKIIRKTANKLVNLLNRKKYIIVILISALLFLIAIDFRYLINMNGITYFNNMILLICFSIAIIFCIYSYFRLQKEVEKIDSLLTFMTKYEKMIDDDRIKRHEILNNLLLLKSFDDKNCEDYNNTLDDLITNYSNNGIRIKNIYKLPHGLKGMFYYKLFGLEKDNIKINLNISKQISNLLSKKNNKDYKILCKIVGITLDNAIEASKISKDKFINVDVYKESKKIIILIENSCNKKVDINKINEKSFSTKGKGRGLGLYIVKSMLNNTNNIKLEQSCMNNIFTTKIIIN